MKIIKRLFYVACGFAFGSAILVFFVLTFPISGAPRMYEKSDAYNARKKIPNQKYVYSSGWFFQIGSKVTINNEGFHSARDYFKGENNGIAVIGDSLVELVMVDEDHLFDKILGRDFYTAGSKVEVFNLSAAGAGLGDIFKFIKFGQERLGCKCAVIKLSYLDISDDISRNHGHFAYLPQSDGSYSVQEIPHNQSSEFYKDFALIRFFFFNLGLNPKDIKAKLAAAFDMAPKTPQQKPDTSRVLTAAERKLFDTFLNDTISTLGLENILILYQESGKYPSINQEMSDIFKSRRLEYVNVSEILKDSSPRKMYSFYNDAHWNKNAVEKICAAIVNTDFAARIKARACDTNPK